jgi:hypothetical protein
LKLVIKVKSIERNKIENCTNYFHGFRAERSCRM